MATFQHLFLVSFFLGPSLCYLESKIQYGFRGWCIMGKVFTFLRDTEEMLRFRFSENIKVKLLFSSRAFWMS